MIIQIQSLTKTFFILIGLVLSSNIFANSDENLCNQEFKVLQRSGKHGYFFKKENLKDLYCGKGFEGKYFKVVYKKENKAVAFDANPELVRRAANVYYHLTKARDFWVNEIKSKYVSEKKQITVRIQITNGFSRIAHFANDEQIVNNNNAWTIPAGRTPHWAENQEVWGQEIWFSPMKRVESRRLVTSNGNNPLAQAAETIKVPIYNYTQNSLTFEILDHLAYPAYQSTTLLETIGIHAGVGIVMFGTVELTRKLDKLFMDKYFYLDTAMIPEVIYHEFCHVALSDNLNPVHSVPVIEGMADYFATRIAKLDKMYNSIEDFSTNAYKNARNKKFYHPGYEHENNADSDFTLSVLWLVKLELDKANRRRVLTGRPVVANADQLIYEARKLLSKDSTIIELSNALKMACTHHGVCDNRRLGVAALTKAFIDKGF